MKKISVIANANIALVKYWGKRDQALILPQNSSISMTAHGLFTHTTVEFSRKYNKDTLVLNNKRILQGTKDYDEYVGRFLGIIRKRFECDTKVKIVSYNNFPTTAGLASSASGFAALALASTKALGKTLNSKQLSILARQGSGSATRSILGGFVQWIRGKKDDGSDSYARQIAPSSWWPDFRMVVCLTSKKEKRIKSRTGMQRTVATSPFYGSWIDTIEDDLRKTKKGIIQRNFSIVGRIAEANCLKMHALMMTTNPPLLHLNKTTLKLIEAILEWRERGLECYFTIDAGPQVKIICLKKDVAKIKRLCRKISNLKGIIVIKPGRAPLVTKRHLF